MHCSPGVIGGTRLARVRFALHDGLLRLVSQPIVDLRTGGHLADELLLRFVGPDGSLELPAPYIAAAERYPLATELDIWVCLRALQLATPDRRIHVNLSARTVTEPAFGDWLEAAVRRFGADASLLTFEITETAPMLDLESACAVADRIEAVGAGLALDDFGTGYGTLRHLHLVLRECGVHLAQGFHIGQPSAIPSAEADGFGSGSLTMRNELNSPISPASRGTSSAT